MVACSHERSSRVGVAKRRLRRWQTTDLCVEEGGGKEVQEAELPAVRNVAK